MREGCGFGPEASAAGEAAPPVVSGDNRREAGGEPTDGAAASSPAAAPGERGEGGRFRPGVSGNSATQFRPGRSGNPAGRPRRAQPDTGQRAGSRRALQLLDEAAETLTQKALELAFGGDPVAVRFCLARSLGTRRGQPVAIDLPAVAAPGDLGRAVGALTAAVANGNLTPEEALHLSQMLGRVPAVLAAVPPPQQPNEDDVRERLIARLDRLAAAIPREERRAHLLADLAALDAEAAEAPMR